MRKCVRHGVLCTRRNPASHKHVEEFFLARGPSSSAEVRVVVIHDIKEVEGERQQEVQEDYGDEEIGGEVNGEVEEGHSTCA